MSKPNTPGKVQDPLDDDLFEDFDDLEDEEFLAMFEEDEKEEKTEQAGRTWLKPILAITVALVLLGNVFAFLPQIFSLSAIEFLKINRELSKSEAIQQYKQAIVVVTAGNSKGTGFNISPDGYIVTNQHVVKKESKVLVKFPDGKAFSAEVIVNDELLDFALLRVDTSQQSIHLPTLPLAESTDWSQPNIPIYVIGNPLFFNQIANKGHMAGFTLRSTWNIPLAMIQAPIYKGNSGSPLINEDGEVIAIVFATTQETIEGKSQKVGLSVPIEHVMHHIKANVP